MFEISGQEPETGIVPALSFGGELIRSIQFAQIFRNSFRRYIQNRMSQ